MMKIGYALAFFALAACASPEALEAQRRAQQDRDHSECMEYGYQPGSPGYGDCRLRLKELRVEASRPNYHPSVGIGYGYHGRHW